jgi:hypothetical protein
MNSETLTVNSCEWVGKSQAVISKREQWLLGR